MTRRHWQVLGCCLVLALAGCNNRRPPTDEAPETAPQVATEPTEPLVAQPEVTLVRRLAMSVVIPASWREAPLEAEADATGEERLSATFQRLDGAELPQVQITLSPAKQFEQARAEGRDPKQLVIDVLRASIEGAAYATDEVKGKVTTEAPWTAPGIESGSRLRIEGELPKAEFGADRGVVDVLVGETTGGDIYTVLVAASDSAGIELAQPLLGSAKYGLGVQTPEPPAAPAEGAAPATESEPAPVTPLAGEPASATP